MASRGHDPKLRKKYFQILKDDGWYLVKQTGDHYQFKHPTKPGKVTVPYKITRNIELHILRQAGLRPNPRRDIFMATVREKRGII